MRNNFSLWIVLAFIRKENPMKEINSFSNGTNPSETGIAAG
jgi:hypothetical protein